MYLHFSILLFGNPRKPMETPWKPRGNPFPNPLPNGPHTHQDMQGALVDPGKS